MVSFFIRLELLEIHKDVCQLSVLFPFSKDTCMYHSFIVPNVRFISHGLLAFFCKSGN